MAAGAWVVGTSWVDACASGARLVGEAEHELVQADKGSGGPSSSTPAIAPRATRHWRERAAGGGGGAFAGLRFAVLPGMAPPGARPDRDDLVRILEAGGGVVLAAGGAGVAADGALPN